jgi:flagellin-like hook-associated protein FlgL
MSSISLNASVRTSLSALKSTSGQLETTTDRLSTGKKVASAIDNPTNFFAAENYTARADALESRLDSMGEATQMINAADNGITAIKAYLSQMKGIVNNALSNTDSEQRRDYGEQFNELITQIQDVAADSSYGGINLIYDNASTTVQFGENIGDSTLELQGFNISSANAELNSNGELGASSVTGTNGNAYALTLDLDGTDVVGIQSAGSNGASGGGGSPLNDLVSVFSSFTLTATTPAADIQAFLSSSDLLNSLQAHLTEVAGGTLTCSYDSSISDMVISYNGNDYTSVGSVGRDYTDLVDDTGIMEPSFSYALGAVRDLAWSIFQPSKQSDCADYYGTAVSDLNTLTTTGGGWSIDWGADTYQNDLTGVIGQIEGMESALQTQSSKLANNLAIITQREDYTQESIDILSNGADDLTLADMNEEGANLLSLQTSQSLAVQALSLSSSSAANVLSILR